MRSSGLTVLAKLLQFQFFLNFLFILFGKIVDAFALGALQLDHVFLRHMRMLCESIRINANCPSTLPPPAGSLRAPSLKTPMVVPPTRSLRSHYDG